MASKRIDLTVSEKMCVIKDLHLKINQVDLAQKYGISQAQVSRIKKNRCEIEKLYHSSPVRNSRKRQRFSKAIDVDEALYKWFVSTHGHNIPISQGMLMTKANKLASELGVDFIASKAWVQRWQARNNIRKKKKHSEKVGADKQEELPVLYKTAQEPQDSTTEESELYRSQCLEGAELMQQVQEICAVREKIVVALDDIYNKALACVQPEHKNGVDYITKAHDQSRETISYCLQAARLILAALPPDLDERLASQVGNPEPANENPVIKEEPGLVTSSSFSCRYSPAVSDHDDSLSSPRDNADVMDVADAATEAATHFADGADHKTSVVPSDEVSTEPSKTVTEPIANESTTSESHESDAELSQVLKTDPKVPHVQSTDSSLKDTGSDSLLQTPRKAKRRRTKTSPPDVISCTECSSVFQSKRERKVHMKEHKVVKPCVCPDCGLSWRCESLLKEHYRIHTGERPYPCSECPGTFRTKSLLKTHGRIHSGEKVYGCDLCDARFSNKSTLKNHAAVQHEGLGPFSCPTCGVRYHHRGELLKHTKTHSRDRPFICTVCGADYLSQADVKEHERTHSDEREFACHLCDARFNLRNYLNNHVLRVHSDGKKHVCETCGSGFVRLNELQRHQRTHTGERPYVCQDCGAAFKYDTNLVAHMRIHSGVKPHACGTCSTSFCDKRSLIRHLQVERHELAKK